MSKSTYATCQLWQVPARSCLLKRKLYSHACEIRIVSPGGSGEVLQSKEFDSESDARAWAEEQQVKLRRCLDE